MAVTAQTPLNTYTGNGVSTAFSFAFLVLQAGDLTAEVDGVLKVHGVDYTVTGVGSGTGGTATFTTAPATGALVELYRSSELARSTDYQDNGDLLADTVNLDFDRLWLALQEFKTGAGGLGTAIRVPEPGGVNALPDANSRANKTLLFDSAGAPVPTLLTGLGSATGESSFVAAESQTDFNLGAAVSSIVSVFINGLRIAAADYTLATATKVTLATGAAAEYDEVTIKGVLA